MPCFDDLDRTLQGPYRHPMASADYLNLSARPIAAAVRQVVEEYLERYPEKHRKELRSRLRSIEDEKHHSAFFELALHELLISQGCRIVSVEPAVPGTAKVPDFLVETEQGTRFYVEARMAKGVTKLEAGSNKILDDALAAIDNVESPDVFLGVFWKGVPQKQVPTGKLHRAIQDWVDGLAYDVVKRRWQDEEPLEFSYEKYGLTLRVEAAPRHESRGEKGLRAIGEMGPDEAEQIDTHAAIKGAVERKAGRYGDLPHPYIIAVNDMSPNGHYEHSIMAALFGTERAEFYRDQAGAMQHRVIRNPNGAWYAHRPINTRVSAAVFIEGLTPWTIARMQPTLVLNPWAKRPLADVELGIDRVWIDDTKIGRKKGSSLGQLVGLSDDWPSEPDNE